ncbi:MAG: pyridoxamine 5'-phosphate oxidase [Planctomycetales bacterium]|nr:pyridoxamine 5'-phosphate oxidase [Planctomycetales bacterium]
MTLPVEHREFNFPPLRSAELLSDPFAQFQLWVEEARAAKVSDWEAMTLATVSPDGRPSARIVFLRGADARGFDFYTNYDSRKGRQLAANAHAALVLHWKEVERQICIEGTVARMSVEESDTYFAERPMQSQLGAWASAQSEPLDSAETLGRRFEELRRRFAHGSISRPEHWGGYRLTPERIEFWQGRPSRLHDRFVYTRAAEGAWVKQRLNP